MPESPSRLERGKIVHVRQRHYLVDDVIPAPRPGDATLVQLSCLDDDAQGQALEVLWEKELDAEIRTGEGWNQLAVKGFDPPRLFSAYYHTLRWNCVTATDAKLFQAPFRAGIQIHHYQLEPLRKALRLPRVNLFIADDVGLGKTIEAGLIARELLLRKKVREIVVACPPSVLTQWQDELEQRFGLSFEVLDRDYMTRVRRQRGYGTNPWTTHSRFLISNRLLVDETYAGPLRDFLGALKPGSLLILDEAHHAAPSSGGRYAIDSKITRAIRDLAPRFEHRLFLSATPHNGHSNSFSALLEILDPQRFCRGVPVKDKKTLEAVMVRRLKEDIRAVHGGFPKREIVQLDIKNLPEDAPELSLSRLLDRYRTMRDERFADQPKQKQAAAKLMISGLQQRLLSSVEAFARTLRVHRRSAEKGAAAAPKDTCLFDLLGEGVGSDDERAEFDAETMQAEEEAQIEAATAATAGRLPAGERDLLDQMSSIAEAACGLPDARVRLLIEWIRKNMCPGMQVFGKPLPDEPPQWNDTRLLIFTEYEDTLRYLRGQLSAALQQTDRAEERVEVYHGPTPEPRRKEIKKAFNADPKRHPVRILLATDAAREGINLQAHCWNLFHFDVPWNPSRLEQRNGRIDRKLQPKTEVFCHYFVYQQRPEDRVLQVLVEKTERIKRELGSLSQVIDVKLAEALRHGIRHADVPQLRKEIDEADLATDKKNVVEEELDAARERQDKLNENADELRDLLRKSEEWVGLREDHFRDAISCALGLVGAEGLKSDGPERFRLPNLQEKFAGDSTWAGTLDSLRKPQEPDQKLWDWRREAPIRPVVFTDPGTMTDDVVHLHLEHRVVRRLLGNFIAQGFILNDLSRACLAQATDAIPRVVLLGRLALYGEGAARLHEELIAVPARWIDPKNRKGTLIPFAREAAGSTLELLEAAMLKPGREPPKEILAQLRATGPRDVQELLPALLERGEKLAADAEKKLSVRGEAEAAAMREILDHQKKRIEATVTKWRDETPSLGDWGDEEKRQLDANRRHWDKRLIAIDRERTAEPERIRDVYRVKAKRIEPVGLVYLWPASG